MWKADGRPAIGLDPAAEGALLLEALKTSRPRKGDMMPRCQSREGRSWGAMHALMGARDGHGEELRKRGLVEIKHGAPKSREGSSSGRDGEVRETPFTQMRCTQLFSLRDFLLLF